MAGINYGRVALGALVGGIVANACDTVVGMFLMADEMQQMVQRLNLDPNIIQSSNVMATWIVADFVYAGLVAWTYAAIRPRFGAGPKTALLAAFVPYASVTAILAGFMAMGVFTESVYLKSAMFSLLTAALIGLAAGKVYKE